MLLWPIVIQQLDLLRYVNPLGLFADPGNWWLFIDWSAPLHKETAMHGVMLYGMQRTLKLARLLGRETDVPELSSQLKDKRHISDSHEGRIVAQGNRDAVLRPKILSPVDGLPMTRIDHPGGVMVVPIVTPTTPDSRPVRRGGNVYTWANEPNPLPSRSSARANRRPCSTPASSTAATTSNNSAISPMPASI